MFAPTRNPQTGRMSRFFAGTCGHLNVCLRVIDIPTLFVGGFRIISDSLYFWQNHNYAVDPESLPEGVEVTHVNLNDGSCAGLAFPAQKIMSLQYHPEASPGPHDSDSS